MSTFFQRTLSGSIYVGLVVASILVSPIFFGVLFCCFTLLAVHEYHHLQQSPKGLTMIAMLTSLLLFAAFYFWSNSPCSHRLSYYLAIAAAIILGIGFLSELLRQPATPVTNWGNLLISMCMIAFPICIMNSLYQKSPFLLLALFITIWVNDTGAYLVGSLLAKRPQGTHHLCPRISPKKSWEGFIGGIVFSIGAAFVFHAAGWMKLPFALLFTSLIALFGTLGDLLESLYKRSIGVKDSGNIMPGHGGILDRFDSILLATPVVWLLVWYCL